MLDLMLVCSLNLQLRQQGTACAFVLRRICLHKAQQVPPTARVSETVELLYRRLALVAAGCNFTERFSCYSQSLGMCSGHYSDSSASKIV
jgi:hypothetical protein